MDFRKGSPTWVIAPKFFFVSHFVDLRIGFRPPHKGHPKWSPGWVLAKEFVFRISLSWLQNRVLTPKRSPQGVTRRSRMILLQVYRSGSTRSVFIMKGLLAWLGVTLRLQAVSAGNSPVFLHCRALSAIVLVVLLYTANHLIITYSMKRLVKPKNCNHVPALFF